MDGCIVTGFALVVLYGTVHCPQPAVSVARYCELARVVRYSRSDTAETRRELRAHNATVRRVCGGSR